MKVGTSKTVGHSQALHLEIERPRSGRRSRKKTTQYTTRNVRLEALNQLQTRLVPQLDRNSVRGRAPTLTVSTLHPYRIVTNLATTYLGISIPGGLSSPISALTPSFSLVQGRTSKTLMRVAMVRNISAWARAFPGQTLVYGLLVSTFYRFMEEDGWGRGTRNGRKNTHRLPNPKLYAPLSSSGASPR